MRIQRRLALLITIGLATLIAAHAQQGKGKGAAQQPIEPAAALPVVASARLSPGGTYDNQPAVAVTADGAAWVAFVRYTNHKADDVVVLGPDGKADVLTPEPGQYVRPVIAAQGNGLWCAWTKSEPDGVSTIWLASREEGGRWRQASRLLPGERRAHQNPEIAVHKDEVAFVYQVHDGSAYAIEATTWEGLKWRCEPALSEKGTSNWDPVAAYDGQGQFHVAWSAFEDGDYDVMWKAGDGPPRRLSARGEYDLHPSLATAPDGSVWASWDAVHIPRHGNSGRTTITGANRPYNQAEGGYRTGAKSWVEVRVLDGDTVRVPGKPREEIVAPKGFQIAHCGLAKVAIASGGEPWILYRALRVDAQTSGIGFYWDLQGRPFRDGKWAGAVRFADSDGYLEEPGVASGAKGLVVAYGSEHRQAHIPKGPVPAPGTADHHQDFDAKRGWNGEIHLATAGDAEAKGPDRATLPKAGAPKDGPVADLRRFEPYAATVGGKTYKLLWGDTHRHSNVSRCSQGSEPMPDDLYRYGHDICRYDWFALSDHAEDPRRAAWDVIDYYWWKQQKLADLYHVPGAMSVLYNLEWSLSYPHGHHNTLFPKRPTVRLDRHLAASSTLAAGWKVLEQAGVRAITIPHTGADPGMGTAWEVQDDRYQRVCEVFQACRGSYEHAGCPREFFNTRNKKGFYWNALEKGYRVGVIASTDHGYGVSYACVYAPENTREAVWQAMWDRRTYGSTTYGLVLDVRSGERWMGEEWESKEAPTLEIYARGAAPIRSVEVIGRSRVLHAEGSAEKPLNLPEVRLKWSDPEWAAQDREQWYYVRVIQADDEIAWSSPVWVKPLK